MVQPVLIPDEPETGHKFPLGREELRDVIDLSLWAGQLLLQNGADTARIEETVHRLGTGLGCDWMDILVSPNGLIITTVSGREFRTRVRRVIGFQVDMTVVAAVNRLSRRVTIGELDRFAVRVELERIADLTPHYNRWLVIAASGLACAAFSRLFGGDWPTFVVTWLAASSAALVRRQLNSHHVNPLLVITMTAFVAGLIAGSTAVFGWGNTPQHALAASVLLLVPGVPLINAAEDLFTGHLVIGLTRGVNGGLISLAIALGLLLAMALLGIQGL
jgi:uncharacterized membrane protein YjjP (DUF1212 family)